MSREYLISGYWKEDGEPFEDYLVTDSEDIDEGGYGDDIFYYGLTEKLIKDAISKGKNTEHDFVITSYSE